MRFADTLRFARDAAAGYPLRTSLSVLAMSIGVAAVVVLTALGDGARRYVVGQFSSLGTNLVIVLPGRSGTGGFNPANAITTTPRDLTVDDAAAVRRAPAVGRVGPLAVGTSEIAFGGRLREVIVAGTNHDYFAIRGLELAQGTPLPDEDWNRASPVIVIGAKVREEVFGAAPAIGQLVRVGDRRLRVVGVMKSTGQGLGMNTDEIVIVPVALAQAMFNSNTLFRILIEAKSREAIPDAKAQALEIVKQRHRGEEDVTVITQDAVLATFDRLLGALTVGVAGIAAISLAVAGILVMNVMLVAVTQRTAEIGLLKALGASGGTIRLAFLAEAAMLSAVGALVGYLLGQVGAFALRQVFPVFPAYAPDWAVIAAPDDGARHRPAVRRHAGAARSPARPGAGADEALAMIFADALQLALRAITAQRLRSFLTLLGIAVGIAAVILLTSIGEGIHRFVLAEFTQFGTNVIGVHPGKTKTGGHPSGFPSSARPLSLDDARALARPAERRRRDAQRLGQRRGRAATDACGAPRSTGLGRSMLQVFKGRVRAGQFLPPEDADSARALVVLGPKLKEELFGAENALGARLRIGDLQFRVIGVLEPKGQFLGIDLDDTAFIPAARALETVQPRGPQRDRPRRRRGRAGGASSPPPSRERMMARHGREDFTIITQEEMLATLSNILDVLTMAVGALGGISLLVGGVGIVTIMTIAVTERTGEIGLLVALGAPRRTILLLFLGEAVALSALGGLLGLLLGVGLAQVIHVALPALPVHTPLSFVLLAEAVAIVIGLAAGVLPARRAAQLDPVEALRAE